MSTKPCQPAEKTLKTIHRRSIITFYFFFDFLVEDVYKRQGYGFDAATETYGDMIANGIVDPTKVNRSALQNAASVASMVLTTESLIADKKEPVPAAPAAPDMGGGMY